jgi:2-polyprenyl-3-methyl-5-hydroxy-6-metoxy-1,4-benzoquinol methylase
MIPTAGCPGCADRYAEIVSDNPEHTVNTGVRTFVSRIRNVLCPACGLIYNDPMPAEQELAELYEAMARDVSERPPGAPPPVLPIEIDQAEFVRPRLAGAPDAAVLDVGCSMGGFLAELARTGVRAVGCEPSPFDAAVARLRPDVEVREGFFEEIEFGAQRFDIVALRFVFEHVRNPRGILRRAAALLKEDGALFLEVPNLATPFIGFDDFFSYGHLQTFVPGTLAAMCAREGLAAATLEECLNAFDAAPHPPSVRALLVKSAGTASSHVDVDGVRALVAGYHRDRQAFVRRVRAELDSLTRDRRSVIYGAGTHTAEMWHRCLFLADRVFAFVDGNPRLQGHHFLGMPVHSPRELAQLAPDLVIVSVRTAEAPIRRFLAEQGYRDRTITIYDQCPAGVR